MNEKGQGDAVFRLLIDSIVGIAILLIIISMITYFNNQVIEQSRADLITLLKNAVNSPDGTIIKSGDLTFSKGFIINQPFVQSWTEYSGKCFSFQAQKGNMEVIEDGGMPVGVQFGSTVTTRVNIQCKPSPNAAACNPRIEPETEADCCFTCLVSFGSSIQ